MSSDMLQCLVNCRFIIIIIILVVRSMPRNVSSVLGIRVGVPHLTKFDVGGVRHWRGGLALRGALMRSVFRWG